MRDLLSQKIFTNVYSSQNMTVHTFSFFSNAPHSNSNPCKLSSTATALNCRPILQRDWVSVWALPGETERG